MKILMNVSVSRAQHIVATMEGGKLSLAENDKQSKERGGYLMHNLRSFKKFSFIHFSY